MVPLYCLRSVAHRVKAVRGFRIITGRIQLTRVAISNTTHTHTTFFCKCEFWVKFELLSQSCLTSLIQSRQYVSRSLLLPPPLSLSPSLFLSFTLSLSLALSLTRSLSHPVYLPLSLPPPLFYPWEGETEPSPEWTEWSSYLIRSFKLCMHVCVCVYRLTTCEVGILWFQIETIDLCVISFV